MTFETQSGVPAKIRKIRVDRFVVALLEKEKKPGACMCVHSLAPKHSLMNRIVRGKMILSYYFNRV